MGQARGDEWAVKRGQVCQVSDASDGSDVSDGSDTSNETALRPAGKMRREGDGQDRRRSRVGGSGSHRSAEGSLLQSDDSVQDYVVRRAEFALKLLGEKWTFVE